jgi:enterochelin esterase family protein
VFASPEVKQDRSAVLRIHAPRATAVRLSASDVPGLGAGAALTKGDEGVWSVTVGPLPAGAYRYTFVVDGVTVVDPRNPSISETNNSVWSLVVVPGHNLMDTKDVPHGAVSEVTYQSSSLKRARRMHVYTPPGYERGAAKYPVFYLLHGMGDCDDSWSSVGRAGFILDNLIAAGKAKPMIVVMLAGHTRAGFAFGGPGRATDEFLQDFVRDIVPAVEKRYRTLAGRANRAIAGLSMGGAQTLNIAIQDLTKFGYLGVYSSGLFGVVPMGPGGGQRTGPFQWEEENKARLDDAKAREGLKLLWFATGKDDFLVQTTRASVELFKKHGFAPVYNETDGGHTWLKWRDYLIEFAPVLFR